MAAERLGNTITGKQKQNPHFSEIITIAKESNFTSPTISSKIANKLYPLDIFAAQAITLAIQRYGQNERTLFSFLEMRGTNSIKEHIDSVGSTTYNLSNVYDYIIYHFYSYLSSVNSDSSSWSAMRVALEKVEGFLDIEIIPSALKIIKSIGLINLFGSAGVKMSKDMLCVYSKYALNIDNPDYVINLLEQHKIIRYAIYKSKYIIFEGTDINIENELLKASSVIPKNFDIVNKLKLSFNLPIEFANSSYLKKGTPRYFQYVISEDPIQLTPVNEIDGYISLIFNKKKSILDDIISWSASCNDAVVFVYFKNTDEILDYLWEIDKLEYIQTIIDDKDTVARREISSLLLYQQDQINRSVLDSLFRYNDNIVWVYKGEILEINSKAKFNKLLSFISSEVYSETPILINEMINKHKPSSAMSLAKFKYFENLLNQSNIEDLGFEKGKYPPEKTIYKTLLQATEIHKKEFGVYDLFPPKDGSSFSALWEVCEKFLTSSSDKQKKILELSKILKARPFKLKQGFIDLWVITFLIIKRNDYSLYDSKGTYVPEINKNVLEIFNRSVNDFSVKAFNVEGIKLDLFNQYRKFIGADGDAEFTTDSLIETIRPFLVFYKKLNPYAKRTNKFAKKSTIKFRNILSQAKDPEKTFFEDLPNVLGFKNDKLINNEEVLRRYIDLIQIAIRDLRSCYVGLIDRLEKALIASLQLKSSDFNEYHKELISQYVSIKSHLLTNKQKTFLNRATELTVDRKAWYESICFVVLDKKLENLLDEEEEYLIDNLIFLFKDLLKYADISKLSIGEEDNFFRFELISKDGGVQPQVVKLNSKKENEVSKLEDKINKLFSGNDDIEIYALLNVLKKKMNNE